MKSLVLVLCFLGLLSTSLAQDGNCPSGFTQFMDSCYAYMNGKQEWPAAQQTCAILHGHLAEVYTAEENQFIINLTKTEANEDEDVWLGGHDLIQEGMWSWAWSGSDFEFTDWASGQPNNGGGDENCMELNKDSHMWNDEQCDHDKHFICQMSVNGGSVE